jgi:hypothetical protein
MVAAANNKIFMNKSNEKRKNIDGCSICGKKLKFTSITEKPNVMFALYDA